jgi:heat shock protein HtpX
MFTNLSWNSSGGGWSSSSSRSSSSSSDSDSKGSGGGGAIVVVIIAIALIVVAWLLSQVVKLALSRSRELLADAGSVELTKNPDAMISALRKIENRGELPGATSAVMELCFDNPREGFADLFATHPSVDSRVKALVQFAGGHDTGPLALPSDADDEPEDQSEPQSPDQLPPPVPHGPWSDTTAPTSRPPPVPPGGPLGPLQGPVGGTLKGPWGRRR